MLVAVDIGNEHKITIKDEQQLLTFKELGLKESDIEEFLRKNIELICGDEESLLIVGQQVENIARGRSDLTAVDSSGSLVLIEIKRDKEDIQNRKEAFEFQAIRYAASYAKIADTDDLVERIYAPYIERHKDEFSIGSLTPNEMGNRKLDSFLAENGATNNFNQKQRIILIASEFDEQTLSAVSWLIANNVDISCYKIVPVKINGSIYLNIERILPVAKLSDFYVDIMEKAEGIKAITSAKKIQRTYLPRMEKLFEWGIIKAGDTVHIKNIQGEEAEVIDSTFVKYKDQKMRFNQWAQEVTGWSSICIYEWVIIKGQSETLDQLRKKRMKEDILDLS